MMLEEENKKELNGEQDGYLKISLVNQGMSVRKKRECPLKDVAIKDINYKNLPLLVKFISERGKILPSRVTGVCVKKQRVLAQAIKRARNLALLSFVSNFKNED